MAYAVTGTFTIIADTLAEYNEALVSLGAHPQKVSLSGDEATLTITFSIDYALPG